MSEIKVNKISPATSTDITLGDSGDTFTVPSGATIVNSGTATGFGGGKIQQVVQTYKTDVFSASGSGLGTWADVTGMSCAITPTKASSKIMVAVQFTCGASDQYASAKMQGDIDGAGYADIGVPAASGSRTIGWFGSVMEASADYWATSRVQQYLWTPSYTLTDVITVKMLYSMASGTFIINRCKNATDIAQAILGTSSITLTEIN